MVYGSRGYAAKIWMKGLTYGETILTREELFPEILFICPGDNDIVYIERRGEDYAWSRTRFNIPVLPIVAPGSSTLPDAWIYYSGRWPSKDEDIDTWRVFFDDLLAEMELVAGDYVSSKIESMPIKNLSRSRLNIILPK